MCNFFARTQHNEQKYIINTVARVCALAFHLGAKFLEDIVSHFAHIVHTRTHTHLVAALARILLVYVARATA